MTVVTWANIGKSLLLSPEIRAQLKLEKKLSSQSNKVTTAISKPKDDNLTIRLKAEPLIEVVLSLCLFDKKDYRSISLTCKKWKSVVSDEKILARALQKFSPFFEQEHIKETSGLAQYRFFCSSYLVGRWDYSTKGKGEHISERNIGREHLLTTTRIYYRELIKFADILQKGKGHEKISNYFIAMRHIVADPSVNGDTDKIVPLHLKERNISPIDYFGNLNALLDQENEGGLSTLHAKVYYKMYELSGQSSDGQNLFHDKEGSLSTGAQKSFALYHIINERFDLLKSPESFVANHEYFKADNRRHGTLFHQLYRILKYKAPSGVSNYAELAFYNREGHSATDLQKWAAIIMSYHNDPRCEHIFNLMQNRRGYEKFDQGHMTRKSEVKWEERPIAHRASPNPGRDNRRAEMEAYSIFMLLRSRSLRNQ